MLVFTLHTKLFLFAAVERCVPEDDNSNDVNPSSRTNYTSLEKEKICTSNINQRLKLILVPCPLTADVTQAGLHLVNLFSTFYGRLL